jgi:hypothetical protein
MNKRILSDSFPRKTYGQEMSGMQGMRGMQGMQILSGIRESCEDQICNFCGSDIECRNKCMYNNRDNISKCCMDQCSALPAGAKESCIESCATSIILLPGTTPPDIIASDNNSGTIAIAGGNSGTIAGNNGGGIATSDSGSSGNGSDGNGIFLYLFIGCMFLIFIYIIFSYVRNKRPGQV